MKVALYCRLSEEDKSKQFEADDSQSIQNQKSMLIGYAVENGWEIYNIYSDDDYTGADRNRPEFKRLLEDAERRKFDIILCKTQSRFTRELELVEKYIHGLFPVWGIRFVSIVDNADTANKGNKKSRQINGLVNEWYLEDMSENIKSVLVNKRKNGLHIGSSALYGYLKDTENKGRLIIDNEAAAIVREVFTLFSKGYGKSAIARILNDRNIPSPAEYKRLKNHNRHSSSKQQSTLWKYSAVAYMLKNEIYIGNMVQGKYGSISYKTKINKPRGKEFWYVVKGTHEPIIESELWDRVQNLITERAKPFADGQVGLFARKARCMNCGFVMRSSKSHGKHYLKCSSRHISKDACTGSFISVERLEESVLNELNRLADEYLDKVELQRNIKYCDTEQEQKEQLEAGINVYKSKITEYAKGIRELYMDKLKGIISENDYLELSHDFVLEKERLEQFVIDNQRQLNDIETFIKKRNDNKEINELYVHMERLSRDVVEAFIDYIAVGKRDPYTGDIPLEIHWQF